MRIMKKTVPVLLVALFTLTAGFIFAEGAQEENPADTTVDKDIVVDFAEVQWSDIASTTAATRIVLEAMGYETTSKIVAVPIAFQSLSTGDIDVFLGDWEPSMSAITTPLLDEGEIIDYHTNLTGAKYTLAVPQYVADAGVTTFSDIAQYGEEFDYKIYGIEPGNDGNQLIQKMIDTDAFGLGEFELIESSEAGMLAQVKAMTQDDEWLVFLGWAPHPMNTVFDIDYLAGGDDYFGPDYGAATVHTITRVGYAEENPNLGRFFRNLEFTLDMEGMIMKDIADGMNARPAAEKWLKQNPAILEEWLAGVDTVDGKDALPVVKKQLGL
ncbi:MAG: choline ABC transporter substrate-binding protein [Sediminispirochaetaceae bacterium]